MGENAQTRFEQLCAFVEEKMKQKGVPGVAVGILQGDETCSAGFGVTHAEHPLPVTDETLFQIGSITKTFTCLAMMRLVEQGKLDLRATVRTYLPEFKVADDATSAQVTLWHLLTHMSGWEGDLFEDTGAGDDALPRYMARMADLEQLAPLGTVWSYNNAGFYLAGYLIEQVTGHPYAKAMRELVFEPLGLQRCYLDPGDVITHRFAVGHHAEGNQPAVLRPWPLPRAAYAAGGIVCDVKTLLRYARFQLGDGTVQGERRNAPEDGGLEQRGEGRDAPEDGGLEQRSEGRGAPGDGRLEQRGERRGAPEDGGLEQRSERRDAPGDGGLEQRSERRNAPKGGGLEQRGKGGDAPEDGGLEQRSERRDAPGDGGLEQRGKGRNAPGDGGLEQKGKGGDAPEDGGLEQGGEGRERVAVLKPGTMARMHAPQASRWGDKAQIGLSWFIDDIEGVRQLSHGGGTMGQISLLAIFPGHDLAVAVLTNADEGGAVTDDVRRWVLEHYLGVKEPKPEPIEATEEELAAYAGFYTRPFADVELGMLCGRLVGQMVYKRGFPSQDVPPPPPPPPASFALCETDRLIVTNGPGKGSLVDVIRKPDGTIGWLRLGRIYRRVEKRSS